MDNLKNLTCLVYDNGSNVCVAERLAKDFGKVYYYLVWAQNGFPERNTYQIGRNIPEIERIDFFWEYVDKKKPDGSPLIDLFVFTDVFTADIATHLKNTGRTVFSAFYGEQLELYRGKLKQLISALNLDVNPYQQIKGVDPLLEFLDDKTDQFVKLDMFRGTSETMHWINKDLSYYDFINLKSKLGPLSEEQVFLVEGRIKGVEPGIDTVCVGGKYPKWVSAGLEEKDSSYLAKMCEYAKLPKELTGITDALSETFAGFHYAGLFSTEVIITDKHKSYFIDSTNRIPEPPGSLQQLWWKNYSLIVLSAAQGKVLDPEFDDLYGVEIIIHSEKAEKSFQAVLFPEKYKDYIKLKNFTIINGMYYVIPTSVELQEIGAVVATGKTLEAAINKAKQICTEIQGDGLSFPVEKIDNGLKKIKELDKLGINFFV
ncbi:MAG: hypothetical protein HQK96_03870 [Nitrospirae bacterium]|nr:hypothetical protein [Nitrospirota bacterium]